MAIIAYPLNNITYNAEDAQTYFSFRQNGVESELEDYVPTAGAGMQVSISSGLAWMRPKKFSGFSVASTSDTNVTISESDASNPRVDRIVLRYNYAANSCEIAVKTGTPAADPTAPGITRDSSAFELGLCTVRVGQGVLSISDENITDTRSNPDVCGIIDAGGDTAVQSVNGKKPDGTGNVTIPTGVMTINDQEPDGEGNFDISTVEPRVSYSSTPPYSIEMQPNTLYYLGNHNVQMLTVTFAAQSDVERVAEYHFIFRSGSTPTVLNLPESVIKPEDFAVEANKIYEVSICENLMLVQSWGVA